MSEIRKNSGKSRLVKGASCWFCRVPFRTGDNYAVDQLGSSHYFSHPLCRDQIEAAAKHDSTIENKPVPDIEWKDLRSAVIFYRGHLYSCRHFADQKTGQWIWRLFHRFHNRPLTIERDQVIGFAGIISWLLRNR